MKNEQVYKTEITSGKCYVEIKLFKRNVLTINQQYINGDFCTVVLAGEEIRALKKMLEGVK